MLGFFGSTLDLKGWAAVAAALVVLAIKYAVPAIRTKEYKAHEQGYDAFVWAAGAGVPGFASSLVKGDGAAAAHWGLAVVVVLLGVFISLAVVACAEASPNKANGKPGSWKIFWTISNYFLGTGAFLLYMLFIVLRTK